MSLRRILSLVLILSLVMTRLVVAAEDKSNSKDKDKDKTAEKSKSKLSLASFMLDEAYPEGPGQPGIFGELSPNLSKLIERIDKATADDKLYGIVLHLDDAQIGLGKVNELRSAIARARKAGKKVYADLYETRSAGYLLACACDEIIMPPVSELTVSGVRIEIMYYKGLLDKLGIKADMLQMGDYKGAAEPMTRENMSPEFRKQTEKVIDDYYQQLVETISAERKLDSGKVKDLIDEGLFTAAHAKEVGLIDRVVYIDEFRKELAEKQHVDEVALIEDYGKKQLDEEDFSGFAGFMKMFELIAGTEQRGKASSNQKIAIIYAVGEINSGESKGGMTGERLGSETIIKAFREAEKDPKVAAIVLRVDSPGGSAMASDLMWREITRIKSKKPVVASMGDIAASGGYYISMGCNKIFAEPGTLTGSIGVVGGKLALKGLFDKVGLTTDSISRGKNNGWMSSDEPFSESERKVLTALMQDCYKQFTEKAAQGRNLPVKDMVDSLAGGRLYSGRMAKQSKLVDEVGTLEDAVAEAKRLAGLKSDEKIDRLILPKPRSFIEELFGGPLMQSKAGFLPSSATGGILGQMVEQYQQADNLVRLFSERAVFVMPYQVHVLAP